MLPYKIIKEAAMEKIKDIFWMYEERVCEKQKKTYDDCKKFSHYKEYRNRTTRRCCK